MDIIAETLSEAHEAAVDAVLSTNKAIEILTSPDKEEKTIEFEAEDGTDEVITIKVIHPLMEPQISAGCPFGAGFTAAYKEQFLTLTPPREDGKQATYTYWNRHEDHPQEINQKLWGNGDGQGIKQITALIEKLAKDPNSRRAVSVTWCPMIDMNAQDPPCMLFIQVVIRKGKVNLRTLFRSQDILLGLCENLVGAAALLEYITNGVNRIAGTRYEVGSLILISIIPHIYHVRDRNHLDMMKTEINRKKMFKLWKVQVK
jgi:thymidylate synthase